MEKSFKVTRNKHLDHMVKVVPVIVLFYALQCFLLMKLPSTPVKSDGLVFLGISLTVLISSFIIYDVKHLFEIHEACVEFGWPLTEKLPFTKIKEVKISGEKQTFSTLTLIETTGKKHRFFFVDDAEKVKALLEERMHVTSEELAA